MSKLMNLLESIKKSDKMSSDEIIKRLADAIYDCDCGIYEKLYKDLYEECFGHKLTSDTINEWVKSMAVTDGSSRESGQKWNIDSTTEYGNKVNIDWSKCSKYEFYAVMNMMYSDNYSVAKSFNLQDDPMYYARQAKAFLCDADAQDNKLFNYYFYVVA